jgi:hypothetical protein
VRSVDNRSRVLDMLNLETLVFFLDLIAVVRLAVFVIGSVREVLVVETEAGSVGFFSLVEVATETEEGSRDEEARHRDRVAYDATRPRVTQMSGTTKGESAKERKGR